VLRAKILRMTMREDEHQIRGTLLLDHLPWIYWGGLLIVAYIVKLHNWVFYLKCLSNFLRIFLNPETLVCVNSTRQLNRLVMYRGDPPKYV